MCSCSESLHAPALARCGPRFAPSRPGLATLGRVPFSLAAHVPLFLYPFLNTVSKTRPFEYLRLTSLGVIGALVKVRKLASRALRALGRVQLGLCGAGRKGQTAVASRLGGGQQPEVVYRQHATVMCLAAPVCM